MFYSKRKTKEENRETMERDRHNREALAYIRVGFMTIGSILSLAIIAKKAYNEFV